MATEPTWSPSTERIAVSAMWRFMQSINARYGLALNDYAVPTYKAQSTTGQGGNGGGCWNMWGNGTGDNVNHPYYYESVFIRGGKEFGGVRVGFAPGTITPRSITS